MYCILSTMSTKMISLYFVIMCINSLIVNVNSRTVTTPSVCKLDPTPGICTESISRYFFNRETRKCELFNYGGCHANGNNFATQEDCLALCLPNSVFLRRSTREASEQVNSTVDQSSNLLPSESDSQSLQESINNTNTITVTTQTPLTQLPTTTVATTNVTETPSKTREDICFQPFAEGTCKENLIRYYYDPEANKCKKFIFKGCFQYDNNFERLEDCEALCVIPAANPAS